MSMARSVRLCDRQGKRRRARNGLPARAPTCYKEPMTDESRAASPDWFSRIWAGLKPYFEKAPLAAFFLGVSSGFPYAMIGATLTTRLAQDGIDKIDGHRLRARLPRLQSEVPLGVDRRRRAPAAARPAWPARLLADRRRRAGDRGGRQSRACQDPAASICQTAVAAILVGVAGATFDIVIDAYRIEMLEPRQLGVGSGMSQYGWRIGSVAAGALALVLAARVGWAAAYLACAGFALPAMLTGADRRRARAAPRRRATRRGLAETLGVDRRAVHGVLPAQGRIARPALHPAPQDRRHARPS